MRLLTWLRRRFCRHEAYSQDLSSTGEGFDRVVSVTCCKCGRVLSAGRGCGGVSLPVKWRCRCRHCV